MKPKRYDPCCCMEEYNHPEYKSRYNEGEYVEYKDYVFLFEYAMRLEERLTQAMEDVDFIGKIGKKRGFE